MCGAPLDDCANAALCMLKSYSRVESVVLIPWGVGPILRDRCGIYAKNMLYCLREVKCQLGDAPGI